MACRILVPQPGIKSAPPALETWSLNWLDCQGSPGDISFNLAEKDKSSHLKQYVSIKTLNIFLKKKKKGTIWEMIRNGLHEELLVIYQKI